MPVENGSGSRAQLDQPVVLSLGALVVNAFDARFRDAQCAMHRVEVMEKLQNTSARKGSAEPPKPGSSSPLKEEGDKIIAALEELLTRCH